MPARFLVLRGGALGDFMVTLPALAALRERWPDAEIELVGYPSFAKLAREAGLVNRVTSLHGANIARFFSLRPEFPPDQAQWIRSFDFVITYLHDPDGTVVNNLYLAGARTVLYGSPLVQERHAIDQMLRPLENLAVYASGTASALPVSDEARKAGRALAGEKPFVLIHPGSGSPRKNWPLENFVALAQRLRTEHGLQTVFLTGEADESAAAGLAQLAPDWPHRNGLDLLQVTHLLSAAAVYVGNDSGITHLAAALGTPTLALFGPSNPDLWAPRGNHVSVLKAPAGNLDQLEVDAVAAEAIRARSARTT